MLTALQIHTVKCYLPLLVKRTSHVYRIRTKVHSGVAAATEMHGAGLQGIWNHPYLLLIVIIVQVNKLTYSRC